MGTNCVAFFIFVCTLQFNWIITPVGGQRYVIRLPPMNAKRHHITLSGFSSGAGLAQQMQFSYSSMFSGIAIFSQTYYRCGPGNGILMQFDRVCTTLGNVTNDELYDPNRALADIRNYAARNLIENPQNLKYTRLYVYAGLNNRLFTADMILNTVKVYENFITDPSQIMTRVQNSDLILPSATFGATCSQDPEPSFFIGNCGVSGPLEAMQFLLGPEIVKPSRSNVRTLQPLLTFDQTEFFVEDGHYMHAMGFLYIPTGCQGNHVAESCLLHFYFHGCYTGMEFVGANHILNSGWMELAEANNIIIVFPQNLRSDEPELGDLGCWDTYGFTGPLYATQKGRQVRIIKRMMDRILGQDHEVAHQEVRPYVYPQPQPQRQHQHQRQYHQQPQYQQQLQYGGLYENFLNDSASMLQIIPSISFDLRV